VNPPTSPAELQHAIAAVPRRDANYTSNLFAGPVQLGAWMDAGELYLSRSRDALLVLRREQDLCRVNHVASDPGALRGALQALAPPWPGLPLVSDIVSRATDPEDVPDAYRACGFRDHARLDRMQQRRTFVPADAEAPGVDEAPGIEVATQADVGAVRAFMRRWLDPLSEQVQTQEELSASAAAGRMLVARDDDQLAGFLIFEQTGLSSAVRYWHVDPAQRGRGVGSRLMRDFLRRCADSRRIVLWVLGDNADAIAKYRHYGFEADGMVDRILARPD